MNFLSNEASYRESGATTTGLNCNIKEKIQGLIMISLIHKISRKFDISVYYKIIHSLDLNWVGAPSLNNVY